VARTLWMHRRPGGRAGGTELTEGRSHSRGSGMAARTAVGSPSVVIPSDSWFWDLSFVFEKENLFIIAAACYY
jgi:hypothetical protein